MQMLPSGLLPRASRASRSSQTIVARSSGAGKPVTGKGVPPPKSGTVNKGSTMKGPAKSAPAPAKGSTVRGPAKGATVQGTKQASKPVPSTASSRAVTRGNRAAAAAAEAPAPKKPTGQDYFNFTGFPFPLGPFFSRNTVRREIEKGQVWVFEQTQALDFFNVYTPVRMTVIKLASGGLWVHAPVAPTSECLRLLKELDAPVEYIVLPTFAYEHKVFVGPFSRRFPEAKVYIAPGQWSYPINLPPQFFGIFPAGELLTDDASAPWADEIEQKVFLPPSLGGVDDFVRFTEVAFFHKRTRTLLVTDAVIYVPDTPPEVIPRQALLAQAKDGFLARFKTGGKTKQEVEAIAKTGPVEDTPENLRKGWMRMVLLVLYFGPSNLLTPEESFAAVSQRLMVGPVVRELVYNRVPKSVSDWVESICTDWDFKQIIPCHMDAPVKAGPADLRRAFAFAFESAEAQGLLPPKPEPEPVRGGFLGINLGNLFGGFKLGLGNGSGDAKPVDFPKEDLEVLDFINEQLNKGNFVKRNADLDLRVQAELASTAAVEAQEAAAREAAAIEAGSASQAAPQPEADRVPAGRR
ncbi:hypothetical protein HYH03_003645 [Edaphochlamys debaryana]|uniref:Uncharacterized protein n=1 Tax=Edaphochlamys debaryana TaxID=47281 RepID=A0A836C2U5_9CHLO|nr:hypothetical protein HYH03_003645 [Edaphochlamys debaryana]|eukprot:KAG2498386.1 hypothetical protein HYH03_003645 [Edaphochlamys debaryana]